MSENVVKFRPGFLSDDPHCEVPGMDDFKFLSEKIDRISETAVSKKVFETRMAAVEHDIANAKRQVEDELNAFSSAITSGEWREGFKRDVGQAFEQLEKRYDAINAEFNRKIEELSKVSKLEVVLSQKIVEFQESIRSVIANTQAMQKKASCRDKWYFRLPQIFAMMFRRRRRDNE